MSIFRCAACGSPNVVMDTQKEGYDYVKGAIGTAILGAGGALAGVNGKKTQVFKCPDCGLTLNHSMPFEIQTLIDMGVMMPSARNSLYLKGQQIPWESFTRQYKNIEKNPEPAVAMEPAPVTPAAPDTSAQEDIPDNEEIEKFKIIRKVAEIIYSRECREWSKTCMNQREKQKKEQEALEQEEKSRLERNITDKRDASISEAKQKFSRYYAEKQAAETKLGSLGFFQFSAKNEAKSKIEQLNSLIAIEERHILEAQQTYEKDIASISSKIWEVSNNIKSQVESKYTLPTRPEKPRVIMLYERNGVKKSEKDVGKEFILQEAYRYIEKNGRTKLEDLVKNCPVMFGFSERFVRDLLNDSVNVSRDLVSYSQDVYRINYFPAAMHTDYDSYTEEEEQIYKEYLASQKK